MFWKNKAIKMTVIEDEAAPLKNPVDYERIAKIVTKSAVVIISVYFGANTVSQILVKTFEP